MIWSENRFPLFGIMRWPDVVALAFRDNQPVPPAWCTCAVDATVCCVRPGNREMGPEMNLGAVQAWIDHLPEWQTATRDLLQP